MFPGIVRPVVCEYSIIFPDPIPRCAARLPLDAERKVWFIQARRQRQAGRGESDIDFSQCVAFASLPVQRPGVGVQTIGSSFGVEKTGDLVGRY